MRRNTCSSLLTLALLCGGSMLAHSQQLQSDGTTAPVTAGRTQHHEHDPGRQLKHMTRRLGLSAEQAAQVQPILAARDEKMKALDAQSSLDAKTMHQQKRAIARDSDAKLNAVLTPGQQEAFAGMRAHHHHGHKQAATSQG